MSPFLHLGTRKGYFRLDRDEDRPWRIARTDFLGVQVPMLLPDPRDGSLYAAVEHGHFGTKLHRSTDNGTSWDEITVPAYPPKPDNAPEVMCPVRQRPIPWTLEKIWSLEAGGTDQPGRLWCGTLPGGLFRSDDHGQSWELVRSLWDRPERAKWFGGGYDSPGIHSICVDPRNSDSVRVAISCGGVWETLDGGVTWTCRATGMVADYLPPELAGDPDVQDPHRMVQCRDEPDHFWVQHHNGIFRSTDACTSWHRITNDQPADFGFAVAVDPAKASRAWFVPGVKDEVRLPVDGKLVVTRTDDGGASFTSLSQGLPQEHAYHLVYRHALDSDPSGSRLAMGSTTGSLWTSDDAGDSWNLLSHDLPPVFCVRFG